MKVKKRKGQIVAFDEKNILVALRKANEHLSLNDQVSDAFIKKITERVVLKCKDFYLNSENLLTVENIQDMVEAELVSKNKYTLAKNYILYRYKRELVRKANSTDDGIMSLIANSNMEALEENSNKNGLIASTQRDLIAGEVSKDITDRILLPEHILEAHREGKIHFHDKDYFIQSIFNCCLPNIEDMLENNTVMNNKLIETPKSFQVACTVVTQIIAAVASTQYGGQSIDVRHLGKYLSEDREKTRKYYTEKLKGAGVSDEYIEELVDADTRKHLKAGIQTIQYQINTLMTTNGQSPFVTMFLFIEEGHKYEKEIAMIIEEILSQRILGIKNEKGVYITPAFPKLIYVLDENNALKGGKYDNVTRLAIKCSAKRLYPDYISAKKMRENYEGNVFSPMGCRSFLSPWKDSDGNYKWFGRFNQGVVSLNLPQIAIETSLKENLSEDFNEVKKEFYKILDERLNLCFDALMVRHNALKGTTSDISPIHWQYGGIARLGKGEVIDKYLMDGYSTISLGYIGVYEMCKVLTDKSHTSKEAEEFSVEVLKYLKETCDKWKAETGLGFGLYGTPAESLCYRFAKIDKEKFGDIPDITDKGYYTNSFHVDVREKIDAFSKLEFESKYQKISSGGTISYIEIPNMMKNLEAMETLVQYMYDHIQYAEFNTKSDVCMECNYEGEIYITDDLGWKCPQCGNTDKKKMNVTRRTCGYLGENFWNVGKTKEIKSRVMHV